MTLATTTLNFEVRTTGDDSNGGGFDSGVSSPGTDYSQQDSPEFSYTDLVIDSLDDTKITSVAYPFDSTCPGNIINISGGAGFITGLFRILSVSGSTATVDRPIGSVSSTGGTGKLGGAVATINKATSNMAVAGQIAYVKAGTYAATVVFPGLTSGTSLTRMIGYSTTRGDNGRATIQAPTTNTALITSGGGGPPTTAGVSWENFIFDGNNLSGTDGIDIVETNYYWFTSFINCIFKRFTHQYCIQAILGGVNIQQCEFTDNAFTYNVSACVMGQVNSGTPAGYAGSFNISDSYFTGNSISSTNDAAVVWAESAGLSMQNCIIYDNTGTNHDGIMIKNQLSVNVSNCTIDSNGRHGIYINSDGWCCVANVQNNLVTNNGGWGINGVFYSDVAQVSPTVLTVNHNAYYGNGSGATTGFTAGDGEVTLSGSPYVSAPSNFGLNSTTGAGLACQGAGTPGPIGLTSVVGTGALDIGALQHTASPSAVGYAYAFVS